MAIGASHNDTSATAPVVYTYQIKACNPSGCSDLSPSDTGFRAFGPPAGFSASDGTYLSRVALSWSAAGGATSYEVYRDGGLLATVTTTSYDDTAGVAGTVYSYEVNACNGTGCSAASAPNTGCRASVPPDEVLPREGALPPAWVVSPGATAGWSVASDSAHEGALSLKSGTIGHSQGAAIQVTRALRAGAVSFAGRASSESGYDYLSFHIDGVRQERWSGAQSWTVVSYPIRAGVHTLKWEYAKDHIVSSGSDAAWTDLVTLPVGSAANDFNGDGKSDLFWRHAASGQDAVWLMTGPALSDSMSLLSVPGDWQVLATGDFDGDGKADVVWRNHSTGENALWLMDGASVRAGPYLLSVPDQGWQVVR
jgi:hypothetical protein